MSGGPDEGTPWFSKSDAEIEEEATKKVQEFIRQRTKTKAKIVVTVS